MLSPTERLAKFLSNVTDIRPEDLPPDLRELYLNNKPTSLVGCAAVSSGAISLSIPASLKSSHPDVIDLFNDRPEAWLGDEIDLEGETFDMREELDISWYKGEPLVILPDLAQERGISSELFSVGCLAVCFEGEQDNGIYLFEFCIHPGLAKMRPVANTIIAEAIIHAINTIMEGQPRLNSLCPATPDELEQCAQTLDEICPNVQMKNKAIDILTDELHSNKLLFYSANPLPAAAVQAALGAMRPIIQLDNEFVQVLLPENQRHLASKIVTSIQERLGTQLASLLPENPEVINRFL